MAGATREALRAATTEQLRRHSRAGRSQTAFSAKTLRAAGLLSVAGVDSFLTARCGALRAAKAALATAKIPRRSAPRSFQIGSYRHCFRRETALGLSYELDRELARRADCPARVCRRPRDLRGDRCGPRGRLSCAGPQGLFSLEH